MGESVYFTPLTAVNLDEGSVGEEGVRINQLDELREQVNSLSPSLELDTYSGSEYPTYKYLRGIEYKEDSPRYNTYVLANMSVDAYERLFKNISKYTEPFVTLVSFKFPSLNRLLTTSSIEHNVYIIFANDGNITKDKVELPNMPNYETIAEETISESL